MSHFHVLSSVKDKSGLVVTKWRIFRTMPTEKISAIECNQEHEYESSTGDIIASII